MGGMEIRNPVYETMTVCRTAHYDVRIWREEPDFKMGPDEEVLEVFLGLRAKKDNKQLLGRDIVDAIGKLLRISAIEVLVKNTKDGGIFYPDWS